MSTSWNYFLSLCSSMPVIRGLRSIGTKKHDKQSNSYTSISSIGIKMANGYPQWACFCSLFGGEGTYSKGGSERSLLSVVCPLPQQTQARHGWECTHEDGSPVTGHSQWSRCHPAAPPALVWSGARSGRG